MTRLDLAEEIDASYEDILAIDKPSSKVVGTDYSPVWLELRQLVARQRGRLAAVDDEIHLRMDKDRRKRIQRKQALRSR